MARRRERRYGADELRRGMVSDDGTCLCCFLHCKEGEGSHGKAYPCSNETRKFSFEAQKGNWKEG